MLVFAAEFPARDGATVDDLLDCCRRWITGSPHYPWKDPAELSAAADQVVEHERDGHRVAFGRVSLADGTELGGVHYVWIERAERRWVTEIVGRRTTGGLWVSVQLSCELLVPGISLPEAKKPYFLKSFIEALGGGKDGEFSVTDRPHTLHDGDLGLAERIVRGETTNALPVVYVSTGFLGHPFVDPAKLAKWLSGLSHVVVEPHRGFSRALAARVDGDNVYGGAVGVYWPRSNGRHFRLIRSRYDRADELEEELQRLVRNALTYSRPERSVAWTDLREALSRKRIDELRAKGSDSVDDYVEAFDAELGAVKAQRDEARRESDRLREVLKKYQDAKPGLVSAGTEQDLYPGEISDIVVRALQDARGHTAEGSRRRIVLDGILKSAKLVEGAAELEEGIKRVLSNTDRITSSEVSELRKLGFSIEDGGKHYKATFGGDARLTFTLFKTASDHRSGKNLASDMIRTLLK